MMTTPNNFSKAVKGFMGKPNEDGNGDEGNKDFEQQDVAKMPEADLESERKNFLFSAKNMAENTIKSFKPENNTTTISKTMVITGEIVSTGDVDVFGDINGTIKTSGDVKVTGKVLGDLAGNNFMLNGCVVQGNVVAKGSIVIGTNTAVVGDIIADSIKINGKIKGNLKIDKMSEFQENALVIGNVKSETISMAQGSKLHGNVSIADDNAQSEKEFDLILGV